MANYAKFSEIAKNCSQYNPGENVTALTNSTVESTSCLNCKNFVNNHCVLDQYDKIDQAQKY